MAAIQPGMKKRQIIANSNRMMFIWIAAMSAVVGVCAVISLFLVQQIIFKTTVTNKLDNTVGVLKSNNKNADTLIENVRLLETNAALNSIKARPEDKALQVILDALPADNNSLALGSSLQQNLLNVNGLSIETLSVESPSEASDSNTSTTVPFAMTLSANDPNILKDTLSRMEKSIRVVDIDSLILERSQDKYTMTVKAHAYYEPAVTVELTNKTEKP
jgi:hypothetical protein